MNPGTTALVVQLGVIPLPLCKYSTSRIFSQFTTPPIVLNTHTLFLRQSRYTFAVFFGRSHKETEVLRAEEHDVSLALSEMSETREESAIQQEAVVGDLSPPFVPQHKCPSYLCSKFRCPKETEEQKRHWQQMQEFLERQGYQRSDHSS